MDNLIASLQSDWQALLVFSPRLIYAVALLTAFLVAGRFVGQLTGRVLSNSERFSPNARFVKKVTTWIIRLAGVLLALGVLGFNGVVTSLLATGGVVAIVLGFAFREIGENFLAGIFLTFSRPFELGDLIKTGNLTGTVRAIDIRSVHVRTADACDVFVPSAQIFRQELFNYTRDGLRRQNFTVGIAYHDEPDRVIELLKSTTSKVTDVLSDPEVFITIESFAENYIEYDVYFFLDTRRSSRDIVTLANDVKVSCWRALRAAGMTFSTDVSSAIEIRGVPAPMTEEIRGQQES